MNLLRREIGNLISIYHSTLFLLNDTSYFILNCDLKLFEILIKLIKGDFEKNRISKHLIFIGEKNFGSIKNKTN